MKSTKSFWLLFSLSLFLFMLVAGCSKKSESDSSDADTSLTNDTGPMSDDDKIEIVMNDAMARLRFKDKSYIYDMEFDYYKDEHSYDEYLKVPRIAMAVADTLERVEVLSVEYFGQDSAVATVELHFKGPSGQPTVKKQEGVVLYKRGNEWIKPTISNIADQTKYQKARDEAERSAKSESGN